MKCEIFLIDLKKIEFLGQFLVYLWVFWEFSVFLGILEGTGFSQI